MANVAVITIVYNETFKLPRWINYYSSQLGPTNCFIIDHGSNDGSTDLINKAQKILLPRTPYDNQVRIEAISSLSHFLLKFFDYVIYTDCDEIIVADPGKYRGLGDFCNRVSPLYIYSIGIDVVHKLDREGRLNPNQLVTQQRNFGHFSAAMCKPNLTSIPVKWARGFHSHQEKPVFGDIFNFHLRYVDLDEGLDRLGITRDLDWAKQGEGAHHKVADSEFRRLIEYWNNFPIVADDPLSYGDGLLSNYLDNFISSSKFNPTSFQYDVDLTPFGKELFILPDRFKGVF